MPLRKTIVSSFFFFSSLVFGFHEALYPSESESHSVVSNSLWPHGLYSPWNSPGQNTGVGSHSLLQGIFPTQGLNPGFPHYRQILYQLSHQGSPKRVVKRERIIQEELMVIWDTVGVMPGLLRWLSGICLQCRRPGFDPWVGRIPWRREGLPTPVFWPGEFHVRYIHGVAKSWTLTEWLSLSLLWSENLSHRLVSSLSYRLDVLCSYSVILVRILKQSIFLCQKFKINF